MKGLYIKNPQPTFQCRLGNIELILPLLLHHFLHGSDELGVMTIDVILWRVIHLYMWIKGGVLAEGATHVAATYLRNTEYQTAVHQCLPPYGSHCSSHRRTNQLADAQLLIYPWETMAVAVVVLANQYAGRLSPLVERILAHHLAMRHKLLILLAAEQGAEVVVQPAATIVTLIHDYGILVAVLVAQEFAIYGAEALAVHRLDMNVCDSTL